MSEYLIKKTVLADNSLPQEIRNKVIRGDYDAEETDIDVDLMGLRIHIHKLVSEVASGAVIDNTAMKCASDTLSQLMKLKESLGKQDKLKRVSEMGQKAVDEAFTGLGEGQ